MCKLDIRAAKPQTSHSRDCSLVLRSSLRSSPRIFEQKRDCSQSNKNVKHEFVTQQRKMICVLETESMSRVHVLVRAMFSSPVGFGLLQFVFHVNITILRDANKNKDAPPGSKCQCMY